MSNTMLKYSCNTIHWLHEALLRVTEELTPEQFCWLPGPEAPPIGWHLWHIARWADRGTRRNIIAIGLALWSAMTVISGLSRSFLQLAFARVWMGVGEAAASPRSSVGIL